MPPWGEAVNPFGSYRALLSNSIAAMSAAIEIYNKPGLRYREECFVILLVNAWELLAKAHLSKSRLRIYYPKKKGQPYRTLSVTDALQRAKPIFPASIDHTSTSRNLDLLIEYRDSAIHFYNKRGFGALVYALSQTAIANYRDVVQEVFHRDLTHELTLSLLPLGLAPPIDPVQFMRSTVDDPKASPYVRAFSQRLRDLVFELEDAGADTGRLITIFKVKLESTKKVVAADFVVGVQEDTPEGGQMLVQKPVNPNDSHPYREVDIVGKGDKKGMGLQVGGRTLGQYEFRAIGYRHEVAKNPSWYWRDKSGAVTRYSGQWIEFMRHLKAADIDAAVEAYRAWRRQRA